MNCGRAEELESYYDYTAAELAAMAARLVLQNLTLVREKFLMPEETPESLAARFGLLAKRPVEVLRSQLRQCERSMPDLGSGLPTEVVLGFILRTTGVHIWTGAILLNNEERSLRMECPYETWDKIRHFFWPNQGLLLIHHGSSKV